MTVPNDRYCKSHLLYRVSCFLLKTMRRRVSAWWKNSVVLCKFSVLIHFGTQKMITQRPIPASVCFTSFPRDDNRTSAGWCGFFLAATGAPSTPIYLLADDWCRLQLNKYSKEPLSLASVKCGHATCLHLISGNTDTGVPAKPSTTCCLLKALQFAVHPNHLRLRGSFAIITSLQKQIIVKTSN